MTPRNILPILLLAALGGVACQGATSPDALRVVLDTAPATAEAPAIISVSGNRVIVRGTVGTPDPCYTFTGRAVTRGDTLDLRLEARSTGGGCIQILGLFRYDLAVEAVPAGNWWVRLDSVRSGSSTVTRLVEGSVRVP